MIKRNILVFATLFSLGISNFAFATSDEKNQSEFQDKKATNTCIHLMETNSAANLVIMNKSMDMMIENLGKKDSNYDERFLNAMIMHHEAAVEMSRNAIKNAVHPELNKMAQDIIDSQEKEISIMKEWRKQWYGN